MLSLRTVARAAPRAAAASSLLAARSVRPSMVAAASVAARASAPAVMRLPAMASFSSAADRQAAKKPKVDAELSNKLDSEIQFETEIHENEPLSTSVQDFIDSGLFEIDDVPGREEVVLRREFNDESITVTFSIADLANYDPEMYDEDQALADEEGAEAAVAGGAQGEGRSAAAAVEAEEADEADEDLDDSAAVPCHLSIVVEKPGQGALSVEATAQDGALVVDNLYYYKNATLAHEKTADDAHAAQKVYPGPAFGSLDEDLQVLLDRYLEERGISQSLAVFVPEYLDAKEQREYLGFLKNLKTFVDA